MQFWQVYRGMGRCLHILYKWYVFYVCIDRHVCTAKTVLLNVWDIYYNTEWFPIFNVADYCILRTLVKLPRLWMQKRWKHLILITCDETYFILCICLFYYIWQISSWLFYQRIYRYFHCWSYYKHLAQRLHCRLTGVLVPCVANRLKYIFFY